MSWFFRKNIILNTKWVDIDWVVGNEVVVMSLKLINGTSLLMVANLLGVTAGGCSFCHERSQLADKDKIVWPFFNRKGDRTSQTVSLLVLVLWTLQPAFYFVAVDVEFYVSAAVMYKSDQFNPPTHPLTTQGARVTIITVRYLAAVFISSNKDDCNSYHQR